MQHGTDEELSSINSVPSTKGRRVFTTGYGMIRSAASLRSAFSPMSDILDQHSFRDWGNRFTVLVETSKETRTRILRTLSLVHLGQTPLPPPPPNPGVVRLLTVSPRPVATEECLIKERLKRESGDLYCS